MSENLLNLIKLCSISINPQLFDFLHVVKNNEHVVLFKYHMTILLYDIMRKLGKWVPVLQSRHYLNVKLILLLK